MWTELLAIYLFIKLFFLGLLVAVACFAEFNSNKLQPRIVERAEVWLNSSKQPSKPLPQTTFSFISFNFSLVWLILIRHHCIAGLVSLINQSGNENFLISEIELIEMKQPANAGLSFILGLVYRLRLLCGLFAACCSLFHFGKWKQTKQAN